MSEPNIVRPFIRRLVEDRWRDLILDGRPLGETRGEDASLLLRDLYRQWQARDEAHAAQMPPREAQEYLSMVEEENLICFDEYLRDADGFYRRLGLNRPTSG